MADLAELPAAIAAADLVISCTGAAGLVITEAMVRDVLAVRRADQRLVLLDLAMPRDVEPAAGALPGVSVIGMDTLRGTGDGGVGEDVVAEVRAIVEAEFAGLRVPRSARRA